MKKITHHWKRYQSAFTLVELLVVIAIIATLAGLVLPVTRAVTKSRRIAVAQAELNQVQTAIESYKAKNGYYPPDNPGNPITNQLYYELEGTVRQNIGGLNYYVTLDGSSQIAPGSFPVTYGAQVSGFMNSSQSTRSSDEAAAGFDFLKGLKPNQIGQLATGTPPAPLAAILVCSVPWGDDATRPMPLSMAPNQPPNLNPWRYVSTSPTNNTSTYDLWVDLFVGGQTFRVSNWSKQPQVY